MNDCNRSDNSHTSDLITVWTNAANSIAHARNNKGRTLFLPLQIPLVRPNAAFINFNFTYLPRNIAALNTAISEYHHPPSCNYVTTAVVPTGQDYHANSHDPWNISDDGLHFDNNGYSTFADTIFSVILGALQ